MYKKSRQGERTPRGFGQKSEQQAMLEKKHADIMAKKEELRLLKKNEELRLNRKFEECLAYKEKKDEEYKLSLADDNFIVYEMGTDSNSFYRSISSIMYGDGGDSHNDIRELIAMTLENRYSEFPVAADIRTHLIVSRAEEVRKGKRFNTSSFAFSHYNCIW